MIKNYIETKDFVLRKGDEAMIVEEILGDVRSVEEIAALWINNKKNLKTIELALLLDFCQSEHFDKERFDAYRMGLGAMNIFFETCAVELQNKMQTKKKNSIA